MRSEGQACQNVRGNFAHIVVAIREEGQELAYDNVTLPSQRQLPQRAHRGFAHNSAVSCEQGQELAHDSIGPRSQRQAR
ncbi:hypothetical protein GCM10007890_10370 [Methylobacterium tardum]|uniref:Uncharacterized protein n=1 Tax=Methylobacterium tardum TaxID=374432 RepID=A0AA37WPI4_9HYPH|nr:hypothetical protein GCM10007890_10370 [Methylobacterium tardum]